MYNFVLSNNAEKNFGFYKRELVKLRLNTSIMNYYEQQKARQEALINDRIIFDGVAGGGIFWGKERPFVLQKPDANLYSSIRENAKDYFAENDIKWWHGNSPTGHTLSSQIACLNHLMPIMNDPKAVLALINGIRNEFTEVLPIRCDKHPAYISFEVVSSDDHLNEKYSTRGSNCTSVDALIMAKHQSGKTILIPIEWKYTESYSNSDKSTEGELKKKGLERQRRYNKLIDNSYQLVSLEQYEGSVYYQEPFYQLMRQTLWAELVIKNKETECLKADDYWHIHVIPETNETLLFRKYKVSGREMEITWRNMLKNQSKYSLIDPEALFAPLSNTKEYSSLLDYLKVRYW